MNRQTTGLDAPECSMRPIGSTSARAQARSFVLRSTQKVVDHYRYLLSTHSLSETERHAILLRLEKHERLLRELGGPAHPNSVAAVRLEAA